MTAQQAIALQAALNWIKRSQGYLAKQHKVPEREILHVIAQLSEIKERPNG